MARASVIMNFDMFYQIEFKTAIRGHHAGHHVYKQTWTPSLGEILQCKKDNRQEALDHDEHAVGVYKFESDDAETMLVGHVLIELSMLLSRFLKASEKNAVEVCGKRRREVGLVIPGHYKALTKSRSHCKILDRELNYMKTKYSHFEIEHELSEERILMPYVTSSK